MSGPNLKSLSGCLRQERWLLKWAVSEIFGHCVEEEEEVVCTEHAQWRSKALRRRDGVQVQRTEVSECINLHPLPSHSPVPHPLYSFLPPPGYRSTLNSHRIWHGSHLASSAWSEMTFQPGSRSVSVFGAIGDLCRAIAGVPENKAASKRSSLFFLSDMLNKKKKNKYSPVL